MSQITAHKTVSDLLRETRILVAPATYVLVGLSLAIGRDYRESGSVRLPIRRSYLSRP